MTYVEEEITFTSSETTLAGTLTLPDAPAKHPAVVLLQGSGPLNRDEEVFGMKPFAIIADSFARNGIAVLRYDSRGVGNSGGVAFQYTLSDVAEDALAAVDYLKTRCEVDSAQIGLCGHSQGGIVAPMCAAQSEDVTFIICLSGIGSTGEEIYLTQTRLIAEVDGAPEDEVKRRVESMKQIVGLIREGASREELEPEIERMVRRELSQQTKSTKDAESAELDCQLTLLASPWFRSFLEHDAGPVLESVKCPVLLIFGELDRQVPAANCEDMVSALERGGNNDYFVRTFPTANHLFQSAESGSPSEYGTLEKEFVPGFLELMSDWIPKTVLKP